MLQSIAWGLVLQSLHVSGEVLVSMGRQDLPLDAKPLGIGLNLATGRMFWTDSGLKARIQRANFNGQDPQILMDGAFTGLVRPKGIAVDSGYDSKVYFADPGTNKIQRASLSGQDIEDVIYQGLGEPGFIALDKVNDMIYWTDPALQKIQKAPMGGQWSCQLEAEEAEEYSRANGHFFATTLSPAEAHTDQGCVITVFNSSYGIGAGHPEGVAVIPDLDLLFWTDPAAGQIYRSNLNGSLGVMGLNVTTAGYNRPFGLAYDRKEHMLYWTDQQMGTINRCGLYGEDYEEVTSGLGNPAGIAFDAAAGTVYWTDLQHINISRLRVNKHGAQFLVMCTVVGATAMVLGGIGAAVFMHVPLKQVFGDQCARMRSKCTNMRRGNRTAAFHPVGSNDRGNGLVAGEPVLPLREPDVENRIDTPLYAALRVDPPQ